MKIFLLDLSQIEVSYRKCCNVGGVDFYWDWVQPGVYRLVVGRPMSAYTEYLSPAGLFKMFGCEGTPCADAHYSCTHMDISNGSWCVLATSVLLARGYHSN